MDSSQLKKCPVQFEEDKDGVPVWRCKKHLMCAATRFNMHAMSCYHYQCPGRRDKPEPRQAPIAHITEPLAVPVQEVSTSNIVNTETSRPCANPKCSNKVSDDSKEYCSLQCRKRKNTADYRARKRETNLLTK